MFLRTSVDEVAQTHALQLTAQAFDAATSTYTLSVEVPAGAALDVFEDEPVDPDARILTMGDKVLLSPHMVSSNLRGGLQIGRAHV